MRWDDDEGEQNYILDEAMLDEAIQYYHSTDESLVTLSIKISLEYDRHSHLGASPLVGREADMAKGYQGTFACAEFSSPLVQGGDAESSAGAAGGSIINGSIDARSSYNAFFSRQHTLHTEPWVRMQLQARDPILDELARADVQSTSSISLSDQSMSDGIPNTGIPPENRAGRDNYSSSRSSGRAGDLEYGGVLDEREPIQ
jgi:hypothetical protein